MEDKKKKKKQNTYTFSENKWSQGYLQELKWLANEKGVSLASYMTMIFKEHLEAKRND